MKIKVVSASEAAFLCRKAFGGGRAWEDTLADMRRGRTAFEGLVLQPYGRYHDGKAMRPCYRLIDVMEFIRQGLEQDEDRSAARPLQVHEVEVDADDDRSWKVRRLKRIIH